MLLHSVFDLKATEINVQHSLIQKLMLRNRPQYHRNKNLNDQVKSGMLEIVDPKAVLQAIETNLASSNQRVPGELGIS